MRAFLLYTCAASVLLGCGSQAIEAVPPGDYVDLDRPDTTVIHDHPLAGYRLRIEEDSAFYYSPFFGMSRRTMPAYPADTTARFDDTLYMVYRPIEDSLIETAVFTGDSMREVRVLRRVDDLDLRPPDARVAGKTYRFEILGEKVTLYFQRPSDPLATTTDRQSTANDTLDPRGVRSMELPGQLRTGRLSLAKTIGKNKVLVHRLILGSDTTGVPHLYLSENRLGGPDAVSGPYRGELLEPLVPYGEADQNLFQQLSRGRIEIQPLPPEPDSLLSFWDREYFLERGGLIADDVPRLSFEFGEDGDYYMFLGERILDEKSWGLSADRNFLMLGSNRGTVADLKPDLRYISDYTDEYIAFKVPLRVASQRPHAEDERFYYYTPDVEVRFYRP